MPAFYFARCYQSPEYSSPAHDRELVEATAAFFSGSLAGLRLIVTRRHSAAIHSARTQTKSLSKKLRAARTRQPAKIAIEMRSKIVWAMAVTAYVEWIQQLASGLFAKAAPVP